MMTFIFDSGFTWGICVPFAWLLAYKTAMPIAPMYFAVQALEVIKIIIGVYLVKKGVWINNIIEE